MFRSIFQPVAAVCALAALLSLNACQKDNELTATPDTPTNSIAGQRNQLIYGVSVASGLQPSRLVEITQATGIVNNAILMNADLGGGNTAPLNDVRGICYVGNGKYVISTGANPIDFLANALLSLDVTTGLAYYLSSSTVGMVTDIDYDPISGNIYGLSGNNLVTITGGAFNTYAIAPITGLPAGYTAKGLTMIGDLNNGTQINIALTQNGNTGTTFVYKVSVTGVSGFIAQLLPDNQLRGGNCGLSYQLTPGSEMYINRNITSGVPGAGLNRLGGWPNQGVVNTGVYGAAGWNLDDMSSDVGQ